MCSVVDCCGQFNPIKTSYSEVVQKVQMGSLVSSIMCDVSGPLVISEHEPNISLNQFTFPKAMAAFYGLYLKGIVLIVSLFSCIAM